MCKFALPLFIFMTLANIAAGQPGKHDWLDNLVYQYFHSPDHQPANPLNNSQLRKAIAKAPRQFPGNYKAQFIHLCLTIGSSLHYGEQNIQWHRLKKALDGMKSADPDGTKTAQWLRTLPAREAWLLLAAYDDVLSTFIDLYRRGYYKPSRKFPCEEDFTHYWNQPFETSPRESGIFCNTHIRREVYLDAKYNEGTLPPFSVNSIWATPVNCDNLKNLFPATTVPDTTYRGYHQADLLLSIYPNFSGYATQPAASIANLLILLRVSPKTFAATLLPWAIEQHYLPSDSTTHSLSDLLAQCEDLKACVNLIELPGFCDLIDFPVNDSVNVFNKPFFSDESEYTHYLACHQQSLYHGFFTLLRTPAFRQAILNPELRVIQLRSTGGPMDVKCKKDDSAYQGRDFYLLITPMQNPKK